MSGNIGHSFSNPQERLPQFRVAVNARCLRACFFCRPSGEAIPTPAGTELLVDDLIAVAKEIRFRGIVSAKLTGGDPALFKPLEEAVFRLRDEAGFADIEVISRHPRIGERAALLAANGVTRFNISLDTLDPQLHYELCGINDHAQVLRALRECIATGLPVKVNMVVMGGVNDDQVQELADFCAQAGVRTLKLLDIIKDLDSGAESFAARLALKRGKRLTDLYRGLDDIVEDLATAAKERSLQNQGGLGHPMTSLIMDSGMEILVKDSTAGAWYGAKCKTCPFFPCHDALMALRLTADLRLQFCLLRGDNTIRLAPVVKEPAVLGKLIGEALEVYKTASFQFPQKPRFARIAVEV